MAAPVKQSSVGKKLVNVSFDLGPGIKTLSIENVSQSAVCFKMQTYEPRLVELLPNKGTIPIAKSIDAEIKELRKGTLATPGGGLNFHLVAMAWPSSSGNTFDQSMWKQLEAKNEPNQVISFGQVPKYAGIVEELPKPKPSSKGLESGTRSSVVGAPMKKIIDVEPSRLSFKPPSSGIQTLKVALKNIASHPVAVKIQTNKRQLYSVKPGKGVIPVGKQMEVTIEAKVTQKDLDSDKERHVMCFIAVPWPSATKEIDAAEFQKIEDDKQKVQKMLMDVDFKGEASKDKATTITEKPATKKYVEAEPLTVTYNPPYMGEIAKITLKNREATPVAYKLQTNRQQLYSVHPNRGIIKADGSQVVKIQIVKTLKQEELFDKIDTHQFLLLAAPWPKNLGEEFDPAQWTTLQASMKDKMQRETMNVELAKKKVVKDDGAKTKFGAETQIEEDDPKKKKFPKKIDKSKGKAKKEKEEEDEDEDDDEGVGTQAGKGKAKPKCDKDEGTGTQAGKGKKGKEKGDKDNEIGSQAGKEKKGSKEELKDDKKHKETRKIDEKASPKTEKAMGPVLLVAAFPTTLSYRIPPDAKDKNKILTVINISKAAVAYKLQGDNLLKKQFCPEAQSAMQGVIQPGEGQGAQINMTLRDTAGNIVDESVESKFALKAVAWSAATFDEKLWKEKEEEHCQSQTVGITVKLVKVETKKPVADDESDSDKTDTTNTPGSSVKTEKTDAAAASQAPKTEQASKEKEVKAAPPIECPREPLETTGPQLLWVTSSPASKLNAASVNLVNSSEEPIAFKCSESDHFTGTPVSGVLQADGNCKITLKINAHVPASEDKNKFQIMAVSWPEDMKKFDAGVWDKQKEKQTILFKAAIGKS